jgi:hypothetical protein
MRASARAPLTPLDRTSFALVSSAVARTLAKCAMQQRRRRWPSVENGAVARAAYEAFRSGDLPGVGSHFADDVVWEALDTLPTGGVIRGRDAVLEQ